MKNPKKTILAFVACQLWACYAMAQSQILVNVKYAFSYVRDLSEPANPYTDTLVLSLSKDAARLVDKRDYMNNTWEWREKRREMTSTPPPPGFITVRAIPILILNKYGPVLEEEVYTDFAAKTVTLTQELNIKTFSTKSAIPKINWKVLPEKKKILNLVCQKAEGNYGGRNYTAWFTTELPFNTGPWLLGGLPGLILEAADSKNEVHYIATDIAKNTDAREVVVPALKTENTVEVNSKDYYKLKEQYFRDPLGMASSWYPGASLSVMNKDARDDKTVKKVVKYNPMVVSGSGK